MKCLLTQLHSHEIRPAESDNTIPACKKTKRHNYPQKCVQYAHYIILRTRHRWLKSKQSFQSQNTPKCCILHSNTHLDPLIKIPSKKSRNLFVHPENKCLQAPCPVFFLSAHCQKLYLVLRSKNAAIYAYTVNLEKAQISGPWPLFPFPYAVDQKKKHCVYTTYSR